MHSTFRLFVAVSLVSSSVAVAAEMSPRSPSLAASSVSPVVGGTNAPAGKWPDAVAVIAPMAACTGTLIAPDVVLTAGHCIETHPKIVVVDTIDYGKPGGQVIAVSKAIAYPSWQDHYDVGVLMLEYPATVKPRAIASACTARDLTRGGSVEVVGFGLTTTSGTGDNSRLHQAKLVVTDPTCTSAAGCAPAVAPNGEFAAGGSGTDACFGDSGGPIYLDDALVGVVSRGLSEPGNPCGNGGIYVRADAVVSWIEKVTHRTLTRARCGAADGEDDGDDDSSGGCSAGGGGEAGVALVMAGLVLRRRRRTP